MVSLHFDRSFSARPGEVVEIAPGLRRITANNPGPMTFTGTNSYLIGSDPVVVLDPGPEDDAHLRSLVRAIGGAKVDAIIVSHSHRDHCALVPSLKAKLQAPVIGAAAHMPARPAHPGEAAAQEASDTVYAPDRVLLAGQHITFGGTELEVIETPGHTMNHLCYAVGGTDFLFSGDHVMAWSTTLVAPPDGAMTPYLASLQTLLGRRETIYLPGHGAKLNDAHHFTQALYAHRMDREAAIMTALGVDGLTVPELVEALYDGLDPRLRYAAGLSVLAHLERLQALGHASKSLAGDDRWIAASTAFESAS